MEIRVGVIPKKAVPKFMTKAKQAIILLCPYCNRVFKERPQNLICPNCSRKLNKKEIEHKSGIWAYEDDEYVLEADKINIFICQSPYYTCAELYGRFYAPGTCNLLQPLNNFDKNKICYCLDDSWFNNKAPYQYSEI